MKTSIETITPRMAKNWLEKNTNNRKMRDIHVNALARQMTAGDWYQNGDAIRLAVDGTVLDGQHRLAACAQSGVPFTTVVVRCLDLASQSTIDVGTSRTFADVLKLQHGVQANENHLAAIVTATYLFHANNASLQTYLYDNVDGQHVKTKASFADLSRWFLQFKGSIYDTLDSLIEIRRSGMPLSSTSAIPLFAGHQAGLSGEVSDFVYVCKNGGAVNDPVHLFREKILKSQSRSATSLIPGRMKTKMAITAWNYSVRGVELERFVDTRRIKTIPLALVDSDGAQIFPFVGKDSVGWPSYNPDAQPDLVA